MTELSHIEAIENELQQIETSSAWNQVYQKVRSDGTYDFSLSEAKSALNRPLNRYRDVLPYDHSRIILQHPTTDYINASLVKVESIDRQYILTQGPLSQTTQHFWLMVWQQQCKGIVMLNKIIEKNMIKCHQYWPLGQKNGGEDCLAFPGVGLKVELVSEVKHHNYIYRTLRLTELSTGISRNVLHFHYTTWPDFGVPESPEAFNKFLGAVISSGCLEPNVGPAVVHCSAGIGRSGTFCLVDTLLVMLERGLCSTNVGTVLEVLLDMRRYRMGLIQTPDQLRFSYQAIVHASRQRLTAATGLGNGYDSGSCEDVSIGGQDEAPPPRPPPRTDSLVRTITDSDVTEQDSDDDVIDQDTDEDHPIDPGNNISHDSMADRTLPAVPPSPGSPPRPLPATPTDDDTPPPPPPRPAAITDDTPPPRPPPASDPDSPPPRPPPASSSPPSPDTPPPRPSPPASDGNKTSPEQLAADMASEVRRRRQRERNNKLSSKIAEIQARNKEAESWQYRKRGRAGPDDGRTGPVKRTKH